MADINDLATGERVKVNVSSEMRSLIGFEGTVVGIDTLAWPVAVRLDANYNGIYQFDPSELDLLSEHYPDEVPC